jgi:hypothetical protein
MVVLVLPGFSVKVKVSQPLGFCGVVVPSVSIRWGWLLVCFLAVYFVRINLVITFSPECVIDSLFK